MSNRHQLHLGVEDHGQALSREEFAEAACAEPWRYERVHGRLSVMTPTGFDHNRPANKIRNFLGQYAIQHPELIDCVFSEAWFAVNEHTDRIADIAVYLVRAKDKGDNPTRVPDVVFEIVSGGGDDRKRDYVDKRAEYLEACVREYIIVDRFERRATVLRRNRGKFVENALVPDDAYITPLLPGLEIPMKDVLGPTK